MGYYNDACIQCPSTDIKCLLESGESIEFRAFSLNFQTKHENKQPFGVVSVVDVVVDVAGGGGGGVGNLEQDSLSQIFIKPTFNLECLPHICKLDFVLDETCDNLIIYIANETRQHFFR